MKQYLSALIQKIGRLNVSIYLLLLSVGYGLYSILPYTLPKIFSGSGGLHVNPFFMVLSILSFLVVPILNYPNNLAMQSVRKYSKQVLFDDLVKKKYMYFDDMETGKIQDLFSESSFCTRSLLYSCVQFIIKHSAIIIINSTAFFNFHFLLGVTYILSYSVYFFISIVLLKKQNNRIHSTLLSASDVNSYLIDYCQNLDSIYSFRSYDKEKEKTSKSAKNKQKELLRRKDKLTEDLAKYKKIEKEYGKVITLSAHMIVTYGNKAWVLYAGNHNLLTETYTNYHTYYEHLKFCKERGIEIYDQFGTIGDLSKDNPRLGLHEFKKKFGGDYIEFMGEFDYVLKPLYYFAFTKLVPIYRNYIKKRKKKELKDEVRNINN